MTSTIARVDRTLMGVKCTVTVAGESSAVIAQHCLDSVFGLEQLWSRFIPTSDISRVNLGHGQPVWVAEMTTLLVSYLVAAHQETDGLFNPALLPLQMVEGDTRSLIDDQFTTLSPGSQPFAHLSNVEIHDDGRIQLHNGITLDAGGLAKGLAADLVASEALALGASGVCINIGGDMAISTGSHEAWRVDIMSPLHHDQVLDSVNVSRGGVATSAINARHRNGSHIQNHIFTTTGHSNSPTVGATVLASHAAWAEAWTKFAIIVDPDTALATISEKGLAALLVFRDGSTRSTDSWKELAR
jgi:thiamine biosynthesis lipoprotein